MKSRLYHDTPLSCIKTRECPAWRVDLFYPSVRKNHLKLSDDDYTQQEEHPRRYLVSQRKRISNATRGIPLTEHVRPRLPKKFEKFIFFRITKPADFKGHLAGLVPLLTTSDDAFKMRSDIYEKKAAGTLKGLIKLSAINVSFSAKGLNKVWLGSDSSI